MSSLLKANFQTTLPMAAHARGVFIYDSSGKDYLDGSGGAMTVSIGHGVKEVLDVMRVQAEKVCFTYRAQFSNQPAEDLADALTALAPGDLNHAFFVNSGSEGTELAMRIAIAYWRDRGRPTKTHILGRHISYHGMTMGALSMSGHEARRQDYSDLLHPFALAPAPYAYRSELPPDAYARSIVERWDAVIQECGPDKVAAVIVEPVVGAAGGALTPPPGYLKALQDICRKHDVLLIADEVITGMGRCGAWFACEHDGVTPDMIVTAKGMSSGYTPMGAVLLREPIVQAMAQGSGIGPFGHTFSGNPLSAAVCLAVVNYMRQHKILDNVHERGTQLEQGLRALSQRYAWLADVRGKGLLWGFEFVTDAQRRTPPPAALKANERFAAHCRDAGLIVYPAGIAPYNNAAIVAPPLVISESEVRTLLQRLEAGMRAFAQEFGLDIPT